MGYRLNQVVVPELISPGKTMALLNDSCNVSLNPATAEDDTFCSFCYLNADIASSSRTGYFCGQDACMPSEMHP